MAKFNFPINPNADRENPFEDEQGSNRFGDDTAPAKGASMQPANPENLYATNESSAVQPYRPGDYEAFLPNRGALVFGIGLIGFCIELLAIAVAVLAIIGTGDFLEGLAYGSPGQLIGLAVSVPAWIMAHTDANAIAAGAMEQGGRRATRWGLGLGVVGTLLGAGQLFLLFGLLVFEELFV